jgi:hypothetical protein
VKVLSSSVCFALGAFGLAIGALHHPVEAAKPSGGPERESDQADPSGAELLIEPTTREEAEEHAQSELDTDGGVLGAASFPVWLHESR